MTTTTMTHPPGKWFSVTGISKTIIKSFTQKIAKFQFLKMKLSITSVRSPSAEAFLSRTNAAMYRVRKSTSPTSTLEASVPDGNFFMKCRFPFTSACNPSRESFVVEPT